MSCNYIFKRASQLGKRCTNKICKKSQKYCSNHIYIDKKVTKTKKIDTKKFELTSNNLEINNDIIQNNDGTLLIKNTNYVVNSLSSKIIIGKLLEPYDEFSLLSDDDIEFLIKNNLKFERFI